MNTKVCPEFTYHIHISLFLFFKHFPVLLKTSNIKLPTGVVFVHEKIQLPCLNMITSHIFGHLHLWLLLMLILAQYLFLLPALVGKPHICIPFSGQLEHPHAAQATMLETTVYVRRSQERFVSFFVVNKCIFGRYIINIYIFQILHFNVSCLAVISCTLLNSRFLQPHHSGPPHLQTVKTNRGKQWIENAPSLFISHRLTQNINWKYRVEIHRATLFFKLWRCIQFNSFTLMEMYTV